MSWMAPSKYFVALLLLRRQLHRRKKRKERSIWVRQLFTERNTTGEYAMLVTDMKLFDHEYFFKVLGCCPLPWSSCFLILLLISSNVTPDEKT